MTTYGDKDQQINLNYGDAPNNDYEKILAYNKEVGCSAKLPTGTCRSGHDHMEDANRMTDMWVKVGAKVKMCRYENLEADAEGDQPPQYIVWKYYGNGNHVILKPYENSKGNEYIMIKGKRLYLDQLQGSKNVAHPTEFEWDYHYHYGAKPLVEVEEIKEEETQFYDSVVINKSVLEDLIKKNQMIYNKNIELSIALMKTTAVLEDLLNV